MMKIIKSDPLIDGLRFSLIPTILCASKFIQKSKIIFLFYVKCCITKSVWIFTLVLTHAQNILTLDLIERNPTSSTL